MNKFYNTELSKLLFHPHIYIEFNNPCKIISVPIFEASMTSIDTIITESQKIRSKLNIKSTTADIIKEYQDWVDLIEINEIIPSKEQDLNFQEVNFEIKKNRSGLKYLINLYRRLVFSRYFNFNNNKKLLKLNPLVDYHCNNYHLLQNYSRESLKNYFIYSTLLC